MSDEKNVSHLPSKAAGWERLLFQIRSGWAPPSNDYEGLSADIIEYPGVM